MTLNYGIFDVSDPQNPDRVYSAALLCRMMAKQIRDGIVHGDGNEMAVTVTDPPAMAVLVGTGTAMVQGRFCENDAALTLAVPTAHATYPRFDRVVVRLNTSPGRTIDIVVKPGTAAPFPVPPALTRTAETWELSLAYVWVAAGATYIVAGNIIDERANTYLCGVACPTYVPSSQLEVVGPVDMQGKALSGLPAPSGSTDAARKEYVDAGIASAIAGFGISDIDIDGPKDWQGENITNLGKISPISWLLILGGDPLLITKTHASSTTVTFAQVEAGHGNVKIVVECAAAMGYGTRTFKVLKGATEIWSQSQSSVWNGESDAFGPFSATAFEDLAVATGDVLTILRTGGAGAVTVKVYATPCVAPYGIVV